jgi:tRNA(Ile)-lysidine synthase
MLIKEIQMKLNFSRIHMAQISQISSSGYQGAFFDMDKLVFPLILRNHNPGDRFRPLGMSGTQKVNRFFINQKISRKDRAGWPVMISQGKVVWIVGHRIDESVKIDSKTRMILKADLSLA